MSHSSLSTYQKMLNYYWCQLLMMIIYLCCYVPVAMYIWNWQWPPHKQTIFFSSLTEHSKKKFKCLYIIKYRTLLVSRYNCFFFYRSGKVITNQQAHKQTNKQNSYLKQTVKQRVLTFIMCKTLCTVGIWQKKNLLTFLQHTTTRIRMRYGERERDTACFRRKQRARVPEVI